MENADLIQIFVVQFFNRLVGPILDDPEIDNEPFTVQMFRRHGDLDGEVVAVEFLAFPADFLQGMGGGKGAFDGDFVHPFAYPYIYIQTAE